MNVLILHFFGQNEQAGVEADAIGSESEVLGFQQAIELFVYLLFLELDVQRDNKLLQLAKVDQLVLVAVEDVKVLLINRLFFRRKVLVFLFLEVFFELSQKLLRLNNFLRKRVSYEKT